VNVDGWIHVSLRTSTRDGNAGKIARNLGGRRGVGGGHQALAAAQIPIPDGNGKRAIDSLVKSLVKRFLKATGNPTEPGVPLCG